jgi:hypothetical protein
MMRNYAQLWLSSIAIAALIASAGAQTWDETANGGGDAGDLPATAQVVSGSGSLTAITGNLGASDVDMYQIIICDPLNFEATTVGGATFDTQLWLFDLNGNGVLHNDDDPVVPPPNPVSVWVQGWSTEPFPGPPGSQSICQRAYTTSPSAATIGIRSTPQPRSFGPIPHLTSSARPTVQVHLVPWTTGLTPQLLAARTLSTCRAHALCLSLRRWWRWVRVWRAY